MPNAANDPQADFQEQVNSGIAGMSRNAFEGALIGSREWAMEQAVASAMIEGYFPNPDFLADAKLLCQGLISDEEMKSRIMARARAVPQDRK